MSVADVVSPREITIQALEAFASVGLTHSGLLILSRAEYYDSGPLMGKLIPPTGARVKDEKAVSMDVLLRRLPATIAARESQEQSVILAHPRGEGVTTFQLDDVSEECLALVRHLAFIVIETSPGSFQAWIAWPSQAGDVEFKRRVKERFADHNATGSVRIPGSLNFKGKYLKEFGAFPRVSIVSTSPGLVTTRAAVAQASGVPEEIERPVPVAIRTERLVPVASESHHKSASGDRWPRYPVSPASRHNADFTFCLQAFLWGQGYDVATVADRLTQESEKAQERGDVYAKSTAERAYRAAQAEPDFTERHARFVKRARAPRMPQIERKLVPSIPDHPVRQRRIAGPERPSQHNRGERQDTSSVLAPVLEPVVLPDPPLAAPPSVSFLPMALTTTTSKKSKAIAITEREEDAQAIASATGIDALSIGRGIPGTLCRTAGLRPTLLLVSTKTQSHLEEVLWGKLIRVRLPEGVKAASEMDEDALRSLVFRLVPEADPAFEVLSPAPIPVIVEQTEAVTNALSAMKSLSEPSEMPALTESQGDAETLAMSFLAASDGQLEVGVRPSKAALAVPVVKVEVNCSECGSVFLGSKSGSLDALYEHIRSAPCDFFAKMPYLQRIALAWQATYVAERDQLRTYRTPSVGVYH